MLFLLSFVSAATLCAQTAGQETSTKAGTTKATTKAATPHQTAPAAPWETMPSGLKYQDVVVGKGPQPKEGDTVVVNYTGKFTTAKSLTPPSASGPLNFTSAVERLSRVGTKAWGRCT